jgi:ribosome maturation factor RimP
LRTPLHFKSAVGEVVTLRELRTNEPTRRLEGVVLGADDTSVTLEDNELGVVSVALDAIERARTVFAWGAVKPTSTKGAKTSSTSKKG